MTDPFLDLLRCPFCGGRFNLHQHGLSAGPDGRVATGVIWCECCAFPIVAGIPFLRADEMARAAMQAIEAGRTEEALHTLLGLTSARADAFRALQQRSDPMTYRDAITVLSPDPEGTYFIYRYSDPTFVMAEAILEALSTEPAAFTGPVLDLCGGSGHLTGVITRLHPGRTVALADMFFWKLWLAATFTAPDARMVCCDGNHPLPFAAGTFPTVVLSDAFPYIWHKRALAGEMVRQAGPDGTIVMPHLHSSLGWNFSAGMTLTPRSYQNLFEALEPRLFPDTTLLNQVIEGQGLNLSQPLTAEQLGNENSFTLIASRQQRLFRRFDPPRSLPPNRPLVVNPLYELTIDGGVTELRLAFPTPEYEEEFGACRRYLLDTLRLEVDLSKPLVHGAGGIDVDGLRRRRVLIDAPPRYC